MSSKIPALSWQRILGYSLIGTLVFLDAAWADVTGGIATDGTMGGVQTLDGVNVTVPQSLGTTADNNLFHSFSEFNINTGQTVTFTGADNLRNVFSRVTGTDITEIEGTLKSSIANAAFYFINPNGITFGESAQVDVPGAFHVSTADKIDFPNNGGAFYADSSQASTLSSEAPVAFGFLGTSAANNGLIEVNGSQLAVGTWQTLDVVAGNISIENSATLAASAGEIRLVARQGQGEVSLERTEEGSLPMPTDAPSAVNAGDINSQDSRFDVSGDGGGRAAIWGGKVAVTGGEIKANNTGSTNPGAGKAIEIETDTLMMDASSIRFHAEDSGNAGNIRLASTGDMALRGGGRILSVAFEGGTGNTGNVNIKTGGSLFVDGQGAIFGIGTRAESGSTGNAKDVSVQAEGDITVMNDGLIFSSAYGKGNAGNISIASDGNFTVWGTSTIIDASNYSGSEGDAGSVTVDAKGNVVVASGAAISSSVDSMGKAGNINIASGGTFVIDGSAHIDANAWSGDNKANQGSVLVTAKDDVWVRNGAIVSSSTFAPRNAGRVDIIAGRNLTVGGSGFFNSAAITSVTGSEGNAGTVSLYALNGDVSFVSGGGILNDTKALGNAGTVSVIANGNVLVNGGNINSNAYKPGSTGVSGGNAGSILIYATGNVSVADGTILSATQTKGNAGEVRIIANGDLTVDGETGTTAISANSFDEGDESTGDAGNVFVDVQGNVELINGGKISSDSFSGTNVARGDAGDVTVNALGNMVLNGSGISTDTSGIGQGGNIMINVGGNLTIDGQEEGWGISSKTHLFPLLPAPSVAGNSGSVDVNVQGDLNVFNGGEISSASLSSGNAGTVEINARAITLNSKGRITSAASAGGQIGDVNVQATDSIILSNSGKISIENGGAAADPTKIVSGSITVTAPDIDMKDSEITSNSTGNVAAGNITVNFSHWLTMDPSFITTTANTGNGGSITINGGELIDLQNSGFRTTVSGANSNGGDIFTTADILVMDTGLIQANAVGGSGGNITLKLDALIPSSNTLLLGGSTVAWQPFEPGFNVIQAASQAGVSGTVSVTAPQLNLSGIIANLGGPQFDTSIISQDYCGLGSGSSLTRKGAGGLKPKSADQLLF